ncbi:MAG: hypothetical protein IT373_18800 [Polyangiaceae bacterium]|nr:hypothetical protein [Polyangiaceae bacterium]
MTKKQRTMPSPGTVKMLADRTLVVTMWRAGYVSAHGQWRVSPSATNYQDYLRRVGGLSPGQEKLLVAEADGIDDDAVDAACRRYMEVEHGWPANEVRVAIMSAPKNGRILVDVYGQAGRYTLEVDVDTSRVTGVWSRALR